MIGSPAFRSSGLLAISVTIVLLALVSLNTHALAQAGSTGGTIGQSNKSISGEQQTPTPRGNTHSARPAPSRPAAATSHYIGCFRDQGNPFGASGRDLNGSMTSDDNLSSARCIALCRSQGFAYAGTQDARQCFCGKSYGGSGAADNCNMACGGNSAEMCGGSWANSVYRVSGTK
jgi:hypothetical protein